MKRAIISLLRYSFLTHMILTLLLTKGVALAEQTSSQEARPALEEGELITYVCCRGFE